MSITGTGSGREHSDYQLPISIKGVVCDGSRVALLKNDRNEWELPGGKLERGESPEACVAREIEEELGLQVQVGPLIDVWVYHIYEGRDVFIVTYGCHPKRLSEIRHSPEHKAVGTFTLKEIGVLTMPDGYKNSIRAWVDRLSLGQATQGT